MKLDFLTDRIKNIRKILIKEKCDSLLLTSPESIRFISDFKGSFGFVIVTKNNLYFISDGRYIEEISMVDERFGKIQIEIDIITFLQKNKLLNGKNVGFEGKNLTFHLYSQMKEKLGKINLIDISNSLSILLSTHDKESLNRTKKAISISKKVYGLIKNKISIGNSEEEIASEISYLHKFYGAEKDAFEPIVAFGKNSAKPHAKPSNRKLKKNDIVLIDIGCVYKGLTSDFTRTFYFGKPSNDFNRIYSIVNNAKNKAVELLTSGEEISLIDKTARELIIKSGYGDFFTHSLGHGIGYNVHSYPTISSKNNGKLFSNLIVTIEPGIYIPGFGGVRIENVFLITENKPINLTNFN